MKKYLTLLVLILISVSPRYVDAQTQAFKIIVNAGLPVEKLTKTQISNLLLKKKSKWDQNGVDAAPFDLDGGSEVRAAMSQEIHGRSVASIKNFWQRQIFSGRDVPPPEMPNDTKMIERVRGESGGIGYISGSFKAEDLKTMGVKVVSIEGE
jgi:ABC-type phosphate transport system substrate-binding protein